MTTFKQALKNDLAGITPAPELLSRVSQIMREEAEKPRVSPLKTAIRFAGMAAAVTLLAFGTVRFLGNPNMDLPPTAGRDATANDAGAIMPTNDSAEIMDKNGIMLYGAEAQDADIAADEPADRAASEGADAAGAAPSAETAPATTTAPMTTAFPRAQYDWNCVPETVAPAAEASLDESAVWDDAETGEGEVPSGGDELALYFALFDWKLASIDGGLIEIVGEEAFDRWRIGKESFGCTTDPAENMNLYALISDFPQHKAAMEARLYEVLEIDRRNGWTISLNEEEIDLLLNGEKDKIAAYFVSPAAVYHDGKIYSPEWLDTHTVMEYEAENLPKEQLREKLGEILWLSDFIDLTALTEKLSEYLGETVTVPEWVEPVRTEEPPAEAIPEDISEDGEEVPEEAVPEERHS